MAMVARLRPFAELVKDNVARSTAALKRASARLKQSGVFVHQAGIPRYSVDENDPKYIIRRLDDHFVEIK